MYIIKLKETKGKDAVRMIRGAVRIRKELGDTKASVRAFCEKGEIARATFYRMEKGQDPEPTTLLKIAETLKAWQIPVEVQV